MKYSVRGTGGMVTAPHHAAASTGARILNDGGTAVEAMVAAAATIAVVYPHMNSLGGDGFWLIKQPGKKPVAIMASGAAGHTVNRDEYVKHGATIDPRGGMAALTVAGTVSGWQKALELTKADTSIPLGELLSDAIHYARHGTVVTESLSTTLTEKWSELAGVPGFVSHYQRSENHDGTEALLKPGDIYLQRTLANTLEILARHGLDSFYRGELAESIAHDLSIHGSPLTIKDLHGCNAHVAEPLAIQTRVGRFWNTPIPTQGIFSLGLIGLFDRLYQADLTVDSSEYIHTIVESTKRLFLHRDAHLTDPRYMSINGYSWLEDSFLNELAADISKHSREFSSREAGGDTVYLSAVDKSGTAVSFIQSIYWEFGSGVILPQTGILWQNRGISFSLDPQDDNVLRPGAFPRHTLNPAMAETTAGDITAYGTMGGDGQPQTQIALASRVFWYDQSLQSAISAPRWLYGRTWGDSSSTLKIEEGYCDQVLAELSKFGHQVEVLPRFSSIFGHASGVRVYKDGTLEGASDPRSDGAAVCANSAKAQ